MRVFALAHKLFPFGPEVHADTLRVPFNGDEDIALCLHTREKSSGVGHSRLK